MSTRNEGRTKRKTAAVTVAEAAVIAEAAVVG